MVVCVASMHIWGGVGKWVKLIAYVRWTGVEGVETEKKAVAQRGEIDPDRTDE